MSDMVKVRGGFGDSEAAELPFATAVIGAGSREREQEREQKWKREQEQE